MQLNAACLIACFKQIAIHEGVQFAVFTGATGLVYLLLCTFALFTFLSSQTWTEASDALGRECGGLRGKKDTKMQLQPQMEEPQGLESAFVL